MVFSWRGVDTCIAFNRAIVLVVLAFGSGAVEERVGFAPASTADAGIALCSTCH